MRQRERKRERFQFEIIQKKLRQALLENEIK